MVCLKVKCEQYNLKNSHQTKILKIDHSAGARLEFEDGLRTGVLPGGYWALRAAAPNLGSILGGVVVIGTLLSDQTPILLSSTHRWC